MLYFAVWMSYNFFKPRIINKVRSMNEIIMVLNFPGSSTQNTT